MSSLDGRKRITRHMRDRRHQWHSMSLCVPGTLLSCRAVSTDRQISAHTRPCDHHEDAHIKAVSKPWYFLVAPNSRMTTAKPEPSASQGARDENYYFETITFRVRRLLLGNGGDPHPAHRSRAASSMSLATISSVRPRSLRRCSPFRRGTAFTLRATAPNTR
jgi:hypothetical protein